MDTPIDPGNEYEVAKRQVAKERSFYVHAMIYAVVNFALFIINVIVRAYGQGEGDNAWWVQWVALAWGIGLAIDGITTFAKGRWLGPEWEERRIRQYMGPGKGSPGTA